MAKKNQATGIYDPETGTFIQTAPAKKKHPINFVIIAVVILILVIVANMGKSSDQKTASDSESGSKTEQNAEIDTGEKEDVKTDLSNVQSEHTLHAGKYTGGIDIPAGKFNITAISGTGNVMTSLNAFTAGGINAVMGISDDDMYSQTYNGAKIPKGETLYIKGNLVVKIEYTKIESDFTGRIADNENVTELGPGQYTTGEEIPEGTYIIEAVSGTGNVQSSGIKEGINEIMGISDDDMYIPRFEHMYLETGRELKISSLTVRLIPETTP